MEEQREKNEAQNKTAYEQAREMAGWLSLYKFGNKEIKKQAARAINSWAG
jgi:hypothetical protein